MTSKDFFIYRLVILLRVVILFYLSLNLDLRGQPILIKNVNQNFCIEIYTNNKNRISHLVIVCGTACVRLPSYFFSICGREVEGAIHHLAWIDRREEVEQILFLPFPLSLLPLPFWHN